MLAASMLARRAVPLVAGTRRHQQTRTAANAAAAATTRALSTAAAPSPNTARLTQSIRTNVRHLDRRARLVAPLRRRLSTPNLSAAPSAPTSAADSAMTVAQLRSSFLSFFAARGHEVLPGSSLVPAHDPSILFTNAGMVQFKEVFLGNERLGMDSADAHGDARDASQQVISRAATAQRCMRAGGKHNDLDNVGFTPRHHTFFEMMGNFSFGDYFKEDAIAFAWEFVTREAGLPADNLRVTVLHGDDESRQIWRKVAGLPDSRIVECGETDNFWSMGHGAGPCGPCSEIFWDQGEGYGNGSDDDRWLEVWNLVFMQSMRDDAGDLTPLPTPCVDTGMGLERMASVVQGAPSNFETDELGGLVQRTREAVAAATAATAAGAALPSYNAERPDESTSALRVVVDHLRAATWLIAEGVVPSNVGRGYVLRRIVRRAVRYAHKLGAYGPAGDRRLLPELVPAVVELCSDAGAGSVVAERASTVANVLLHEEEIFLASLRRGLDLLDHRLARLPTAAAATLSGEDAFQLYDTYGFPLDLTAIVARERGYGVDMARAEALMEQQRQRARDAWGSGGEAAPPHAVRAWQGRGIAPTFVGYAELDVAEATVLAVEAADEDNIGTAADRGEGGDAEPWAWVSVDPCPFYPEGGGQVGDTGALTVTVTSPTAGTATATFAVLGAVRPYDDGLALRVARRAVSTSQEQSRSQPADDLLACLRPGGTVRATVDVHRRRRITAHHTGTHLLHEALRRELGADTVMQAGSFVGPDYLRFDFTHAAPLSQEQLDRVEAWAAGKARAGGAVAIDALPVEEAKAKGALAQFGERYGSVVRVVSVLDGGDAGGVDDADSGGDGGSRRRAVSVELCGGCHVSDVAELVPIKVLGEASVAAGVRRLEAVCGAAAVEWLEQRYDALRAVALPLGIPANADAASAAAKATKLAARTKALGKEVADLRARLAAAPRNADAAGTVAVAGEDVRVLVHIVAVEQPQLQQGDGGATGGATGGGAGGGVRGVSPAVAVRERANAVAGADARALHVVRCGSAIAVAYAGPHTAVQAGAVLKALVADAPGSGRGGGKAAFAQGQLGAEVAAEALLELAKAAVARTAG